MRDLREMTLEEALEMIEREGDDVLMTELGWRVIQVDGKRKLVSAIGGKRSTEALR